MRRLEGHSVAAEVLTYHHNVLVSHPETRFLCMHGPIFGVRAQAFLLIHGTMKHNIHVIHERR